jgi:hypothetical protein
MNISFREAALTDAPEIADLIRELAQSIGETSPITPAFVKTYLVFPSHPLPISPE